ncbi:MAG: hypothetical protein ACD_75C01523G0002 [uncultured bacterium]|nr:MAG: hypothetical protein ACD_75C01523G0002 [uncultured bacterium]
MQNKKLSDADIKAHAGTIASGLIGMKSGDGVRILCAALNLIVTRSETEFPGSIRSGNVNFLPRKPGRMLKIDNDLKLKEFILSFDRLLTIKAMHEQLVEEFGAKRTPSENTIRSYFQRLSKRSENDKTGK